MEQPVRGRTVYTIGHSNRPIDEFLKLLKRNQITLVADVRSVAGSTYNPQFNGPTLSHTLRSNGVGYVRLEKLGGFLTPAKESPNNGLEDEHFRAYADYMLTDEFREAISELIDLVKNQTVAVMCSEALPTRCHRQFLADALIVRGFDVEDIFGLLDVRPHVLTRNAVVVGDELVYPKDPHQAHLF